MGRVEGKYNRETHGRVTDIESSAQTPDPKECERHYNDMYRTCTYTQVHVHMYINVK